MQTATQSDRDGQRERAIAVLEVLTLARTAKDGALYAALSELSADQVIRVRAILSGGSQSEILES